MANSELRGEGTRFEEEIHFRDLSYAKKELVRNLFADVLTAISPNDPTGHLPNCGYSDGYQICDCAAFGRRLHQALTETVNKAAVYTQ
jgi:hypothetical protein